MIETLKSGGPLMIPIIFCGIFATFIIIERCVYFYTIKKKDLKLMSDLDGSIRAGNYEACAVACAQADTPMSQVIKKAVDELNNSNFSHIAKNLTEQDPYMVLADFADYSEAQRQSSLLYTDASAWNKISLINIANAGIFAADRSIRDYAEGIWKLTPIE